MRLDWLLQQVHGGRSTNVRFSFNSVTMTEKVTFALEPWDGLSRSIFRPVVMGALQSLQVAMLNHVVTDKGHTHKSAPGKSVVEFWIKATTAHNVNAVGVSCDGKPFVPHLRESNVTKAESEQETISLVGEWKALPASDWSTIYERFTQFCGFGGILASRQTAGGNTSLRNLPEVDRDVERTVPVVSEDELVMPVVSEEELVEFLVPRAKERCDAYLIEIHSLFMQGGCSRGEIMSSGLANKVTNSFPKTILDQLSGAAQTLVLERVHTYIEQTVSAWD
jgi:hypothetical protein